MILGSSKMSLSPNPALCFTYQSWVTAEGSCSLSKGAVAPAFLSALGTVPPRVPSGVVHLCTTFIIRLWLSTTAESKLRHDMTRQGSMTVVDTERFLK